MQPVGVGIRIAGALIDFIIVMIVMTPIYFVAANSMGLLYLLSFLVGFGYYIAMEALKGQTVGKMVLGTKVVKKDGTPISWQESIIRNLLRIVDNFFFFLVGIICIAATANKQRVGDMAAGTLVVKK